MKLLRYVFVCVLMSSAAFAGGYNVGDKAGPISLKNVDNKIVTFADFPDAKGFIVVFTCNHCPYSKMYEDRLIALHNTFSPLGYPVIAINSNSPEVSPEDSYPKMQERSKKKGFPFKYLFDETQEVAQTFGATRTPHVYLLNKQAGDLVVAYIGAIDNNAQDAAAANEKWLESAIRALANGMKPSPDFTKAIGCTIKFKT